MSYADLTVNDGNPIKRALQRRRLAHSLHALAACDADIAGNVLDVGAGDGLLCGRLAERWPRASITCYEPAGHLREQAEQLLAGRPNVRVVGQLADCPSRRYDWIFCLEVLEHLPGRETRRLFDDLLSLSDAHTHIVLGVPNELHLLAALKGAFRATRRWGSFDTRPGQVVRAVTGRPPLRRPLAQLAPGVRYYFHHLGFDYRRLRRRLDARFKIEHCYGSPFPRLPLVLNSEVYLVVRPRPKAGTELPARQAA